MRPSSSDPSSGRSEESIKSITQRFDVEIVFKLSLASKGLTTISCLERCTNLTDLDLSNNVITKMEGLDSLPELRRLNLSCNKLSRVEGLEGCKKLDTLKLQGNQISLQGLNLEALSQLAGLRSLHLQNMDRSQQNPACKQQGYKAAILASLASLTNLDGERSPSSINYVEIVEEVQARSRNPPAPKQVVLPEVEPWLQVTEPAAPQAGQGLLEPEFQQKAVLALRRLDECHALAEVLREEVGKAQKQLLGGGAAAGK